MSYFLKEYIHFKLKAEKTEREIERDRERETERGREAKKYFHFI
jgi:hypothetical protein